MISIEEMVILTFTIIYSQMIISWSFSQIPDLNEELNYGRRHINLLLRTRIETIDSVALGWHLLLWPAHFLQLFIPNSQRNNEPYH